MLEIVTLSGLRALKTMKEKPKGWKACVIRYLEHREDMFVRHKSSPNSEYYIEQYIKALQLARELGVKWMPKSRR